MCMLCNPAPRVRDESSRPAWAAQWDTISKEKSTSQTSDYLDLDLDSITHELYTLSQETEPCEPPLSYLWHQYASKYLSDFLWRKRDRTHHLVVAERADFGARIPEFRIQPLCFSDEQVTGLTSIFQKMRTTIDLLAGLFHELTKCLQSGQHIVNTQKMLPFIEHDVHEYRLPAITWDHLIKALGSIWNHHYPFDDPVYDSRWGLRTAVIPWYP